MYFFAISVIYAPPRLASRDEARRGRRDLKWLGYVGIGPSPHQVQTKHRGTAEREQWERGGVEIYTIQCMRMRPPYVISEQLFCVGSCVWAWTQPMEQGAPDRHGDAGRSRTKVPRRASTI